LRLVNNSWYQICSYWILSFNFIIRFRSLDGLRRFTATFPSSAGVLLPFNQFAFASEILFIKSYDSSILSEFGVNCGKCISSCHLEITKEQIKDEISLRRNVCYLLANATNLKELHVTSYEDVGRMGLDIFSKLEKLRVTIYEEPSVDSCFLEELSTKVPSITTIRLNLYARKLPKFLQNVAKYGRHHVTCRLTVNVGSILDSRAIRDVVNSYSPLLQVTEIIFSLRVLLTGNEAMELCRSFAEWLGQQSGSLRHLVIFDKWNIIDDMDFPVLPFLEQMNMGDAPHYFSTLHSDPCTHFPRLKTFCANFSSLALFSGGGSFPTVKKLWLCETDWGGPSFSLMMPNVETLILISSIHNLPLVYGLRHLTSLEVMLDPSSENVQWTILTGIRQIMSDETILGNSKAMMKADGAFEQLYGFANLKSEYFYVCGNSFGNIQLIKLGLIPKRIMQRVKKVTTLHLCLAFSHFIKFLKGAFGKDSGALGR